MYSLPDKLSVGEVKAIMRILQIGLNNVYDERSFIKTSVNPQDIVDLIVGNRDKHGRN